MPGILCACSSPSLKPKARPRTSAFADSATLLPNIAMIFATNVGTHSRIKRQAPRLKTMMTSTSANAQCASQGTSECSPIATCSAKAAAIWFATEHLCRHVKPAESRNFPGITLNLLRKLADTHREVIITREHGSVSHGFKAEHVERHTVNKSAIRSRVDALYDPLTKLPDAGLFFDRLQQALLFARRENHRVSVMFIRLDRIEGSIAPLDADHHKELLQAIGTRLSGALRVSDSAGRLDIDRFGVVLPHAMEDGVPIVASRIMGRLIEPFHLSTGVVSIRSSVGIAICTELDMSVEDLCGQANEAMNSAHNKGGGYEIYHDMNAAIPA